MLYLEDRMATHPSNALSKVNRMQSESISKATENKLLSDLCDLSNTVLNLTKANAKTQERLDMMGARIAVLVSAEKT